MTTLREILQDKFINGFIVALVLGISTVNFISQTGGMVLDHILPIEASDWNWKIFYGQLILYATAIIAAILIRRRVAK